MAEFNIQQDPEAARIVVESGLHITMVPLEVTHTVLFDANEEQRLRALDSRYAQLLVELLNFFRYHTNI